jgi:NAD(P)-dependent dehydrogenase (short-subunit alcohol dehydrogenase family)
MTKKIALVTGATRGIGRQIVQQLGELGYTVLVGSRDLARGQAVVEELTGLDAEAIQLEVTDETSIRRAAQDIERDHGHLDVLVNNAAIIAEGDAAASEITADVLRRGYETNVVGLIAVTQAMLPLLRKEARIVNLSTGLSSLTALGDQTDRASTVRMLGYQSSKIAVNLATVMLANELRGTGILVNAADPGKCATEMGGLDTPRTAAEGAAVAVRLATLPEGAHTGELHSEEGRVPW